MLRIGCHLSSSKGFLAMGKTALSIGANTFQFFTRNPRGGKAKAVNPEDAAALVKLCQENNFAKLLAHAPYTMNPCAADEGLRDFARTVMEGDLEMLEYVPGNLYNVHPGSHVKQGVEVGIEKISANASKKLKILFFKGIPPFRFVLWDINRHPVREAYRILGQSLRTYRTSKSVQCLKCFSFPQRRDKYRFA